jgi:hypothetical protein
VIPFFERFNFFSFSKKKNFSLFKRLASLVEIGAHLNPDGFKEIVALREKLNKGEAEKENIIKTT